MQQVLPDKSIVSLKEVRVSEILESKSKGLHLQWSLPGYQIVADPEWVQYVRRDGSVILPFAE